MSIYYPLLSSQTGVVFESIQDPEWTRYNLPCITRLDKSIDIARLETAILKLCAAHKEWHTRFVLTDDGLSQYSDDTMQILIKHHTMTDREAEQYAYGEFIRPFDMLSGEPLVRWEIIIGEERNYVLHDFHHSIADGYSYSPVLNSEISAVYNGGETNTVDYGLYEYADDCAREIGTPAYQKAKQYYHDTFSDTEFVTLNELSGNSAGRLLRCPEYIDHDSVEQWCEQNGVSSNLLFMAAFTLVIGRLTRKDRYGYVMLNHGRMDKRLAQAYGMFVNSTVASADITASQSVMEFIKSGRRQMMSVIRYRSCPFSEVVNDLGIDHYVSFNFLGMAKVHECVDLDGKEYRVEQIADRQAAMDFCCDVYHTGDSFEIRCVGPDTMFTADYLHGIGRAIKTVLIQMMENSDARLGDISLVSAEEEQTLLTLGAGEQLDYDTNETWLDMFKRNVTATPNAVAVADRESQLTYRELDEQSDLLAAYLINEVGVQTDDFVAIKMPRVKEFVVAVVAIHKASAAYVPIDPEYPADRIEYMLDDCQAKTVIETLQFADGVMTVNGNTIHPSVLTHQPSPTTVLPLGGMRGASSSSTDSLAYMIYTSGSTGKPKGVMLTHRGLLNFTVSTIKINSLVPADRISSHRSFSFDAHIEDIFPVLAAGASVHIMPDEIRKDLDAIHRFLVDHDITGGGYTTSIARLLLQNYKLTQRYITCGGEALTDVVSGDVQIINVYGPTECTDHATTYALERGREYTKIPIGRPLPNMQCYIMDANQHLLPYGMEGELCVAGPQLACGYWNNSELTEQVFKTVDIAGTPICIYCTGDLCRWTDENQIEYVGRKGQQVKLRGYRIELGEIESAALGCDGICQVAAKVMEINGTLHLILYYTINEDVDVKEEDVRQCITSSSLASYMHPEIYVHLDAMPTLPNGKVNRKALPEPELLIDSELVEPETELEAQLLTIVKDHLGMDNIGVTTNLIAVGLTSLSAMRLGVRIQTEMKMPVRIAEILKDPSVRSIADSMNGKDSNVEMLTVYPRQELYPLTENQRGVYLDWVMNADTTQYNLPAAFEISSTSADRIVDAFRKAIDAHPYMKMRLVRNEDDVMQQRHDEEEPAISITTLSEAPDAAFFQSRVCPFDLMNDRLYRAEVYRCNPDGEEKTYLFFEVHHIIFDGLSVNLFLKDILSSVNGIPMAEETVTAYDFALFMKNKESSSEYAEAEQRYDKLLDGAEAVEITPSATPDGTPSAMVQVRIPAADISTFCADCSIMPSNYMHAAFGEVLRRTTREEHPVYLTVTNGRSASLELMNTVGMYVNTLPVVYNADSKVSVADAVKTMQQQLQESYANDFYPYTRIVERHGLRGRILFAYQAEVIEGEHFKSGEDMGVMGANPFGLQLDKEKFPLSVGISTDSEEYVITFSYDGLLYSKRDMETLAQAYSTVLTSMHSSEKMCDVSLVDKEEQQRLIALGTGETMEFDRTMNLVDLFTRQAKQTPENIAVVYRDRRMTYREVDELTDRLAVHLHKKYGVCREQNVGVMIERSELMVVYPIAIMKAGAAYMPLDPTFAADRLQFMCEDAEVRLVLTDSDERIMTAMPEYSGDVFRGSELQNLDAVTAEQVGEMERALPENKFVILYTSGSTGRPKAVILEHHNMVNYAMVYARDYKMISDDRAMAYANFGFDAHMIDIYPTLSVGGSVCIIPDKIRLDLSAVHAFVKENAITTCFMTTQLGHLYASNYTSESLRLLSVGGEKLMPIQKPRYQMLNIYGPTETTISASIYNIEGYYDSGIIGRPLANYSMYIVDESMKLVPEGVAGELIIAGEGVGRGYLNRPELTEEKFLELKIENGEWKISPSDTVQNKSLPSPERGRGERLRIYRTGDLVRWSGDELEFLGRIDSQVKLRGFRIELGEIESVMMLYEGIRQAAVVVKDMNGGQNLCAYYVADGGCSVDIAKLKEHLGETLTHYMIPSVFMQLDAIPMTPNGKVNRKALPDPELSAQSREIVLPQNETEAKMLRVAQEFLPGIEFGVTDDLQALGMTSLIAMRYAVKLQSEGIEIKVSDMLKNHSIRSIATHEDTLPWWWYSDYKQDRPTIVFVNGITEPSEHEGKFEAWDKYCNVLIIEPITNHYDSKYSDYTFSEIIDEYMSFVEIAMHSRPELFCIIGLSIGGAMAYEMAVRWDKRYNVKPLVILGDTTLPDEKTAKAKYFKEYQLVPVLGKFKVSKDVLKLLTWKFNIAVSIGRTATLPEEYAGRVILIRAMRMKMLGSKKGLKALKKLVANLEVIEMKGKDHFDICKDPELNPFYDELIRKNLVLYG